MIRIIEVLFFSFCFWFNGFTFHWAIVHKNNPVPSFAGLIFMLAGFYIRMRKKHEPNN